MLRSSLLLVLLTHSIRTAYVTNSPSFSARLDRLYERIERIHAPSTETHTEAPLSMQEPKWKRKLEKLNALTPYSIYLSPEDEDLLQMTQTWGMLSPEQVDSMAKDLQRIREEKEERSDLLRLVADQDSDYDEMDEYLADYADYRNGGKEDEDDEDEPSSEPPFRIPPGVTPSAFTREDPLRPTVVSAVESMAATNERPQVLEASSLSSSVRATLNKDVFANIRSVMNSGKCEVPQPRWLMVRQLAPAADTIYLPPSVKLHRCASDSGCCNNETEVCAPVEGRYVTLPFFLITPDKTRPAHIVFYNHTTCACVSRETLRATVRRPLRPARADIERIDRAALERSEHIDLERSERQNDWRPPTERPVLEVDVTAPPPMRRCTCPAQFIANMPDKGPCSCVCEWPDTTRRRDCLSLSRGDEHFGLRDRVCVQNGDCTPPTCKYGAYNTSVGKCPVRKYRRIRYSRRYHPEKALVV